MRKAFSLGFTRGSFEIRMANRYVEKISAGDGREGWPGGKAWSIDAWKRGMLRKNPNSVANGRKRFNLSEINKWPTPPRQNKTYKRSAISLGGS